MAETSPAPAPAPASTSTSSSRAICAAVNPRSGGNKGRAVLAELTALLGAERVFDLTSELQSPGRLGEQLRGWAAGGAGASGAAAGGAGASGAAERPALLVCGGDGTVSWLLTALVECELVGAFSVATIPLGTANDFARVMGWSNAHFGGIAADAVERLAGRRDALTEQHYDVWCITQFRGAQLQTRADFSAHGQALRSLPVINYWSIGFDAKVAYEFGEMRNRHPRCLASRLCNMLAYGCLGLANSRTCSLCCCKSVPKNLGSMGVSLTIDGSEISLPCCVQQITCINVPSYANGTQPWGSPGCCGGGGLDAGAVDDGRIEVFAIMGSFHGAAIQARPRALAAHGLRLGQGSRVEVTVPAREGEKPVYLQYDGEAQPFERGVRYVFERQFSVRAPSSATC